MTEPASSTTATESEPVAMVAKLLSPKPAPKKINDNGRVGILLSAFASQMQGKKAAGLSSKATHRFKPSELSKLLDQLAALQVAQAAE